MIKNIIFDFGGVILNIDYQLAMIEFQNLGIENVSSFYSQSKQFSLFDELETGRISPDEFRDKIRIISGKKLSNEVIDLAWNKMILDLPAERITLLEKTKKTYRTFLLSNTNSIHYVVYIKALREKFGYDSFSELFEKVYFSHLVKMRKPEREIFELLINQCSLNPSETLFIDDSYQHIEAAGKLGIQTHFLKKEECINGLFEKSGLLKPEYQ